MLNIPSTILYEIIFLSVVEHLTCRFIDHSPPDISWDLFHAVSNASELLNIALLRVARDIFDTNVANANDQISLVSCNIYNLRVSPAIRSSGLLGPARGVEFSRSIRYTLYNPSYEALRANYPVDYCTSILASLRANANVTSHIATELSSMRVRKIAMSWATMTVGHHLWVAFRRTIHQVQETSKLDFASVIFMRQVLNSMHMLDVETTELYRSLSVAHLRSCSPSIIFKGPINDSGIIPFLIRFKMRLHQHEKYEPNNDGIIAVDGMLRMYAPLASNPTL
ncbi:hypothetical protein M422DRAFT_270380 [Sphaerobolus stellatus SS14]|uniref:Uncharacterized protein n=1 Tax=Sphaerobolus stellatus (strain SS14) TaxID=990650 RepID=A0A0C9U2M2_SPHS4|nr:hypothetical protein M422DRAFT_270380 [Sphaerobolus stellatus SS14]